MRNVYLKVKATPEHIARTGEGFVTKTNIKQCNKCQRFKPHWHFLEARTVDGLGTLCQDCRASKRKPQDTADQSLEYYMSNPMYYKLMQRARYLERKAEKKLLEAEQDKLLHQKLYPGLGFYSAKERWAHEDLVEAKRLRKLAGKPTH